ncbi:phosphoribosylformylglycinamidine cyclo-ligase [candidate division KSB1 bacterium]|nr:phosphoribosylformylglycinamidine cyclo-ligase [candidate division KSB1 bacterium]NIR68705.1 phosphoribosylformylglycinamidine cyclo-ligase [candidate division KSB1 bacterium]NIS25522.1 phosphoribosylformylglycinamidine cyclo-ligase [candidate division KSB1 bacterium]NIT72415.1 phosphoribosylformylglycinamidine cyclo-ligase [candidate division KSB1 bacterium]NIU26199.1 phosphoribosylformylglycinamidine cyclo-ligase [candidate division KSB1 bacterium]
MSSTTYKIAGVDRSQAEQVKDSIKQMAKDSFSDNVLRGIGLFSGFYALNLQGLKNPVLVSSIDGVGTKVRIAQMMEQYRSIGIDLVNHCVNDIMVSGADPLFFMDYIAANKLNLKSVQDIVHGISGACKEAKCALIGGETAEMPGIYSENSFDVAGSIIGLVDRDDIIDGYRISAGDVLIGAASNGLHTNGYSLVRKIFFEQKHYQCSHYVEDIQSTLGAELLKPHRSYRNLIQQVRALNGLHGIAHVTGGGIEGNTHRLLAAGLGLHIDWSAWEVPAIFRLIQGEGEVPDEEMRTVFNLGVGLVLVVEPNSTDKILETCQSVGEKAWVLGTITTQN